LDIRGIPIAYVPEGEKCMNNALLISKNNIPDLCRVDNLQSFVHEKRELINMLGTTRPINRLRRWYITNNLLFFYTAC
jgi:hypothetical protein